ncbi:hypothetical protein BGZ79_002879 [Entomortierella chlamydospora]|nr:hypothetical protein BGZ79_002879 [Entomortierella chlamydospora]
MNSSNGITETNVEDMSNAELFQYLFKAELGADLPEQLSPDMPPSMPSQPTLSNQADPSILDNSSLSLVQTVTATASSSSPSSSNLMPPDEISIWIQRFQHLQQLRQLQGSHNQQQQEPGSSSQQLASGAKNVIYPSPPINDDMLVDSDSDDNPSREDNNVSDPLKPSASELKKMTSKERRQLRNKLSARNFRVRRKEYISSLENQVKEARREASELQKKLAQSELNCQILRQELETTRLSQTLFNDGRMSKEHANLLASLLNPNTESFPTTTSSDSALSSIQLQQQQQKELMDSINDNNMTILNNSLTIAQPPSTASNMNVSHGSLQPFVPFDGNWELIINRAEMVVDPALDPKDVQSKEAVYHDLLARYEAAKYEAEVDEQMRTELKAYHDQKLSQTYIVMPKEDAMFSASNKASQDTLVLQTMVYMMMIHLTRSLFEAATLSKTQLVNVYQTMDEPLRSKMGQEQQQERPPCKFREWRESWMRRRWPSFYNNRQRVCELLKNGLCPSTSTSSEVDIDETVRKMEEGVKDKTVEPQLGFFCVWLRGCINSWISCHQYVTSEVLKAMLPESSQDATA